MVRSLMAGGLGRAVIILGVIFFAVYAVVALVLGRTGFAYSEGVAAGVMAYLFIMAVLVLWLLERRRRTQPGAVAEEFLVNNRVVRDMIGAPVTVSVPSPPPAGKGPGQVSVDCFVSGPDGSGEAMVVMARLDKGYQVLGADLDVAGVHKSVAA